MMKPKSIATGVLKFGTVEVDCYVLDNGRRVLSQRGILGVLSGRKSGVKTGGLDRFLDRLPDKFAAIRAVPSIEFDSPTGPAIGRDAMLLVDICAAYAEMRDCGELHHKQQQLATNLAPAEKPDRYPHVRL